PSARNHYVGRPQARNLEAIKTMYTTMQYCIRVSSREIHDEIQRLMPVVQGWLFAQVKELTESGSVSGIQSGEDEYIGVDVEVYEESLGYLTTRVFSNST